jgi:hypothetical protein
MVASSIPTPPNQLPPVSPPAPVGKHAIPRFDSASNIDDVLQGGRFCIRLQGLSGPCEPYNGRSVLPFPVKCAAMNAGVSLSERASDRGQAFEVRFDSPRTGSNREMVVNREKLVVNHNPDYGKLRAASGEKVRPSFVSGNNRSSVKLALQTLLTSIRTAMHTTMKDSDMTVSDIFARYDSDSSGEIDMDEFIDALNFIGVSMTPAERSMVFKSLDTDRSGGLHIGEFVELVQGDENDFVRDNTTFIHMLTHERRASRISAASKRITGCGNQLHGLGGGAGSSSSSSMPMLPSIPKGTQSLPNSPMCSPRLVAAAPRRRGTDPKLSR